MAFSLIELLVACSLLVVVVVLLAVSFSNFTGVTATSGRRLQTGNETRTAFDRMAFDLSAAIRQSGVEPIFRTNRQATSLATSPNDSFILLADARSTLPGSRFARVGYEIAAETNEVSGTVMLSLYRCSEPFQWSDNILSTNFQAPDRQPIARGVFRMELSYIKTNGAISSAALPVDELSAIVCTTASLDEGTYTRLKRTSSQLADMAALLPDSPAGTNSVLPLVNWKLDLFNGDPSVKQNVRFDQRYFYLK